MVQEKIKKGPGNDEKIIYIVVKFTGAQQEGDVWES